MNIKNVIKNEKGEIQSAACRMLEDMVSDEGIELLLKLADSNNKEIKGLVLNTLIRISHQKSISQVYYDRINNKLEMIESQNDWIVR